MNTEWALQYRNCIYSVCFRQWWGCEKINTSLCPMALRFRINYYKLFLWTCNFKYMYILNWLQSSLLKILAFIISVQFSETVTDSKVTVLIVICCIYSKLFLLHYEKPVRSTWICDFFIYISFLILWSIGKL